MAKKKAAPKSDKPNPFAKGKPDAKDAKSKGMKKGKGAC